MNRTDHADRIIWLITFPYYCDECDRKKHQHSLFRLRAWLLSSVGSLRALSSCLERCWNTRSSFLNWNLKRYKVRQRSRGLIPVRAEQRTRSMCLMFCNLEANVPLCSFSVKTKVKTETSRQMNGFSSNGSSGTSQGLSRAGSKHKADRWEKRKDFIIYIPRPWTIRQSNGLEFASTRYLTRLGLIRRL